MTSLRFALLSVSVVTLISFTGCVGPMACGPLAGGCGGCDSCSGCGELYIDPWINDPADQCDPCDCCGNFNGQSCGKCRPMFSGLKSLWGYKNDCGCDSGGNVGCGCESGGCSAGGCDGGCSSGGCGAGGCDGGCSSCGGGGGHESAINYSHGGESYIQGEPTYADQSAIQVSPRRQAYQPEHTRKIFNPKSRVQAQPVSTRSR